MIKNIYAELMIPYYGIKINKVLEHIWYAPDSHYYCVFDWLNKNQDEDCDICYFDDYKNNKSLIMTRRNGFDESFILLCFLAQKENCKASDIMQWLSGISSKEEYIQRAKYIRKKIEYGYPCSVAFEGEEKDIFDEEKDHHGMAGMLNVREKEDYYEVYYDHYPERSNHRVQETVAIIYDKTLLYPYLLNKQFNLLRDRAEGELPLLD
ncbi:hypothetical protein [Phocoenobacter skyensis]|uniref:Uncharacterized protein n=1 Tax=Phocoenobacter skyensis TaxID=97481 RepID=A0AAJ6NDN3_9PAST|nr:hypothetical protein [Pasteurella skyensis]MDP8174866.1 hypothetical protein [Pasteurella skyensis]